MAEFGLLSGLAVRNTHQGEIDDLKYFEQLNKQNEAINMAKAKILADDFQFQVGSNNHDNEQIRIQGNAILDELAALKKAHPSDFWTNPDVQRQKAMLSHKMKIMPPVLNSMAFTDAQDKYNVIFEDYLKNPSKYDDDEIQNIRNQLATYDKMGHAEGEVGLKRDGGARPITFMPPHVLKDYNELYSAAARDLNPDEMIPFNNGMDGAYIKRVSESSLKERAEAMYQAEPFQYKRYEKQGKDPINEIMKGLRLSARTETYNGVQRDNWKEKMNYKAQLDAALINSQNKPDIYDEMVLNKIDIPVHDNKLMQVTFGSTPAEITFKGPDGKDIKESGNEFNYTRLRDADKGKKGFKIADGYITKSIDYGLDNGAVRKKHFWESGDQPYVIKPDLIDTYSIIYPPKNSDEKPMLQIKARTLVDANSNEAKSKYNSQIRLTADQKNSQLGSGSMVEAELPVGTKQGGYEYIGGDPASQNSWKKL